jgi:isoleucyl-tRNA synthetase
MQSKYREYRQLDLPEVEAEMLKAWESESSFQKSIDIREGAPPFVFYEGPPSANGMPGIHHVISRTLKDMVCRYKTMRGFQVKRKGGWDTHGLPVELGVEKELGITKEDIGKTISVEDYNRRCREAVLRYKDKWDDLTRRMGYWVDLENPYVTFENDYIESLWWCLKRLYEKGLLYESVSIQPYSPAAGTGLSSHELNQPGTYKEVKDVSCVAMFKVVRDGRSAFLFQDDSMAEVHLMAWTTTPWTLPSNLGLTVGPSIGYARVLTYNPYTAAPCQVILAEALLDRYFKGEAEGLAMEGCEPGQKVIPWKVLDRFKGADLEGVSYEQLLPFEANHPDAVRSLTPGADPFRVVLGDFVTTEDGTGIVHTAPAFGADDYKVGRANGLGILTMVDREGRFVDGLGEFSGRFVKNYKDDPEYKDVNLDICLRLKRDGLAFRVEKYEHSYPHCWRTDKPILYYPLDAWFIRTTAMKDRMVELNRTIQWKPRSTGEGRFGNWLENMVDWNLSRSRFWGTPLPIWRTDDGAEARCIGSIEELRDEMRKAHEALGGDVNGRYLGDAALDLHKPYVDEIVLVSDSGKPMRRVPDLVDVWFDSGAMPYAQWHFPFENRSKVAPDSGRAEAFPADFIAEGVDQTRGWFYTLHALAVLLFDSVAYRTVVSNGLVLDRNGNKMSKRLGNVVDPFDTIARYGADATRWYLITNASPWDNLKFDTEGIREVQRKFFGTLFNTYQFFILYANVDGFRHSEPPVPLAERPEIDRWILSALHSLTARVRELMDDYEPTLAGRAIEEFTDAQLSNWYVRLSRRRFWKGDYGPDKLSAYQTLFECLETLARLVAPISPFFSDSLFRNLNVVSGRLDAKSVHHTDFPESDPTRIEAALEERMRLAQEVSSLILSIRKKVNIRVRQPLGKALVPVSGPDMQAHLEQVEELVKAEVNVKEVEYISGASEFIRKRVKPNFVILGKRLGSRMKEVSKLLGELDQDAIRTLETDGRISLSIGNEDIVIELSEVEIQSEDIPGWMVAARGGLTVALDIRVTEDLELEGYARELVNRIQKIRKDAGFELTDRILVKFQSHSRIDTAVRSFKDYICAEILADGIESVPELADGMEIELHDVRLNVHILKSE